MYRAHLFTAILLSLAVSACAGDGAEVDTTASGVASYRDATTDHDGNPAEPAQPDPQGLYLEITVDGVGDLSGVEPACSADQVSGAFEALFAGEATLDSDGVYAAALASGDAELVTATGCAIPELEITAVTEVVVRASLEASAANCAGYCEASARADAESECGGDASCRASAEAEYAASCTATCTRSDHAIVAESRLSADAIAAMNASAIDGAALGELEVALVFDHVEDGDGNTVAGQP